jgi:hypothetical protein
MNSRTWFGAKIHKPSRESKLLALLPPMLRPEAPPPARAAAPEGEHGGDPGWTVGLWRGPDLPPLRLSIRPQNDARMSLRFDPIRFDPRSAPALAGALAQSLAQARAEPREERC